MALTKETRTDKIEVQQLGPDYSVISVRRVTIISENGVEISSTYHRQTLSPEDDLSEQEEEVKAIASVIFTDTAKAAYAAAQEAGE